MSIQIFLEPYQQTFSLSRDFIQNTLHGSLFADTLKLDPEATFIPLTNPVITPAVMQFLVDYSQGKEPDKHIPDLIQASGYLRIPWMLYYVDPLYDAITDRAAVSLNLSSHNLDVVNRAIKENRLWVVGYFLIRGFQPSAQMIERASHDMFKLLLSKYNFDYDSKGYLHMIEIAAQNGWEDILNILFEHPSPLDMTGLGETSTNTNWALYYAALSGQSETVKWLLQRPDVDPTVEDYQILYEAARKKQWPVVNILLADPRVKEAGPDIVEEAINH